MPKLRLAAILQRLALAAGDRLPTHKKATSCPQLAARIAAANNISAGQRPPIDGRTLANLIYDKNYSLSKKNLEPLHNYLRAEGYDLAQLPIFAAEGLLHSLVEKQHLSFLLSTRSFPGEPMRRGYMSDWDVRAMGSVMDAISSRWKEVRVGIQQEPMRSAHSPSGNRSSRQSNDNPSRCIIGSPLVSAQAESELSAMFHVPPFERPARNSHNQLPFYFVWHPPKDQTAQPTVIASAFSLEAQDLSKSMYPDMPEELPARIADRRAQAFVVGHDIYEVRLDAPIRKEYGIAAAQRRPNNEIVLVIAGLSGPSTFSVAEQLAEINLAVPDCPQHEASSTIYAVVEATIKVNEDAQAGDNREVTSSRILVPPAEWSHAGVVQRPR
jgi:hypothetical protein